MVGLDSVVNFSFWRQPIREVSSEHTFVLMIRFSPALHVLKAHLGPFGSSSTLLDVIPISTTWNSVKSFLFLRFCISDLNFLTLRFVILTAFGIVVTTVNSLSFTTSL